MSLQLEKGDKTPISSVTLNALKNNLDKTGKTSYGRVRSNSKRITIANLAAVISERHVGIEPGMITYVARLLHEETMRQLKSGRSVEALGLGTVYVGTKGSMKGDNPSLSDVPKFVVKFRNAKETVKALENIKVGDVTPIVLVPVINIIEDLITHKENSELKKDTIVKITGKRLRIEGNNIDCGIYFSKEDGSFVKVNKTAIIRNEPSCLEFILPSGLVAGSLYSIVIKNQNRNKKGFSKNLRVGTSEDEIKIVV